MGTLLHVISCDVSPDVSSEWTPPPPAVNGGLTYYSTLSTIMRKAEAITAQVSTSVIQCL